MKQFTSRWVSHQLSHQQRVKLCRENFKKVPGDNVIL